MSSATKLMVLFNRSKKRHKQVSSQRDQHVQTPEAAGLCVLVSEKHAVISAPGRRARPCDGGRSGGSGQVGPPGPPKKFAFYSKIDGKPLKCLHSLTMFF